MGRFRGFTLVELLVAISILGIIAGTSTIALNNARGKGRDSQRKQDLFAIKSALVLYFENNGQYPFDSADANKLIFVSSDAQPWIPGLVSGGYIKQLPLDPQQIGLRLVNQLAQYFDKAKSLFGSPVYAADNRVALRLFNDVNQNGIFDAGEDFTNFNSSIATVTVNGSPVSIGANGSSTFFSWAEGTSRTITITTGSGWTGTRWRDQPFGGGCNAQVRSYSSPNFTATHTVDGYSTCFNYFLDLGIYQPLVPSGSISANPNPCSIAQGQDTCTSTITWSSSNSPNPAVCVNLGTGENLFAGGASGSQAAPWIQAGINYVFTLYSNGCGNGPLANVTVTAVPSPPIVDIKANGSDGPISVNSGSSVAISWTTTNSPTSCTASGAWSGAKSTSGGSENIVVTANGTYTLSCTNAGGANQDSVVVNVVVPTPTPTPTPSPTPSLLPSPPPPSPTPSPSPPPGGTSATYMYIVSADKKSFILWAQLENENDSEIYSKATATCRETPPLGSSYNYCLKAEF